METIPVHVMFVMLFVIGIFMICNGRSPYDPRTKEDILLTRCFLWGFILLNGMRWTVFFLPTNFMASLGG